MQKKRCDAKNKLIKKLLNLLAKFLACVKSFFEMSILENLSEEQKKTIALWAEEGKDLSEIQLKLLEDFETNLSYKEARFLLIDLGIELKPSPEEKEETPEKEEETPNTENESKVTIELDSVVQADSLVSGKVIFSDGNRATWQLDQLGRLGLNPEVSGYRPSEEDIAQFQEQLKEKMSKSSGIL